MPSVVAVIESLETRGTGVPDDPVRWVKTYHTLDGTFLAERDEYLDYRRQRDECERHKTAPASGSGIRE
jgi:hypothetical protein